LNILDLGAGTGHLVAKAWRYLHRLMPEQHPPSVTFHFVDANPPSFGRSFGLSRDHSDVAHIEWTTADYRTLVDDDQWLNKCGPFDWVFICRTFDNASNFLIEPVEQDHPGHDGKCLPHRCLAPHRQPQGMSQLLLPTVRRRVDGGAMIPQFSLRDYFAAILAVQSGSLDAVRDDAWYLPVRRFNPASLITPTGRSLLGQLLKAVKAIIIEDVDVEPEHLSQHRQQFGLAGTAAVHCVRDGFATEARQYVVTTPQWARHLPGQRLW
jgi:hypothetical protein